MREPGARRSARSCASATAWNVPAVGSSRTPSRPSRVRSSPAALRVNVTASTWAGSIASVAACQAMRRVSTRVLPEPAAARIASGWAGSVTARAASRRDRRGGRRDPPPLTLPKGCDLP